VMYPAHKSVHAAGGEAGKGVVLGFTDPTASRKLITGLNDE
jgi:hypothetical protein